MHLHPERAPASLSSVSATACGSAARSLTRPGTVLLDEPSNHLDDSSLDRLVRWLVEFPGIAVFVTHDRWLLDAVATAIFDLDPALGAGGTLFGGSFHAYREARAGTLREWRRRYAASLDAEGELSKRLIAARAAVPGHWQPGKGVAKHGRESRAAISVRLLQRRIDDLRRERGPAPPDPLMFTAPAAADTGDAILLELIVMGRFDPGRVMTSIRAAGEHPYPPGTRWPLDGGNVSSKVLDTGRPVTIDPCAEMTGTIAEAAHAAGIRGGVGAPIVVHGRVWGTVSAGGTDQVSLAPDIERRLTQFTDLLAIAISNAQAREELQRLADEQAALRRIATLVAQGARSQLIFDAVCEETGRVFAATTVNIIQFTADGLHIAMSGWSVRGVHVPTGTTLPLDGPTIDTIVRDTGAPGRCDSYEDVAGELAALIRRLGIRSEVGAPVVVDGEPWGALIAGTDQPEPLPAGTEHRLAGFAELIATAVSNTTACAELLASRARVVKAADEQRRRVVRDLHDGAQQRLAHAAMTLQLATAHYASEPEHQQFVSDALEHTRAAIEELRELAHGIHPALLASRGLAAAVEALADRAPLPVLVDIPDERYPAPVESAAYFIAAEALTNVAKYANAATARITATRAADCLVLAVEDDGAGGASPSRGSGLSGLQDRVAAFDGTLTVESPLGAGTRVRAKIPLRAPTSSEPLAVPLMADT